MKKETNININRRFHKHFNCKTILYNAAVHRILKPFCKLVLYICFDIRRRRRPVK